MLRHSGVDVDRLGYDGFQALMKRWGRHHLHLRLAIDTLVSGEPTHDLAPEERLCLNVDRVVSAVLRGELEPELKTCILHTHTTTVDVEVFEAWSVKVGLPILRPWPEFADRNGRPIGAAVCFPHRTRELEILSVLARELHD